MLTIDHSAPAVIHPRQSLASIRHCVLLLRSLVTLVDEHGSDRICAAALAAAVDVIERETALGS